MAGDKELLSEGLRHLGGDFDVRSAFYAGSRQFKRHPEIGKCRRQQAGIDTPGEIQAYFFVCNRLRKASELCLQRSLRRL